MNRVWIRAGQSAGALLARLGPLAALLAVGALLAPGSALASGGVGPLVTTNSTAQNIDSQTELISGLINPHGLSTSYTVQYATAGSSWCMNGGSGSGATTASTTSTLTTENNSPDPVSFSLAGLTKNTAYCAVLSASNGATTSGQGTTPNTPVTFTVGVPTVATQSATGTGDQQATVHGTIDPASQATTYEVYYTVDPANNPAAWCTDPTTQPTGESKSPITLTAEDALTHAVTIDLDSSDVTTPLQPGTNYCAAIVATNVSSSNVSGTNLSATTPTTTFLTDAAAALSPSSPPVATGSTTVQVTGTIDPDGESTEYFLAYEQVGQPWCQGQSGGSAPMTTPSTYPTLSAQDQSEHSVTLGISGLTAGETYCVELVAQNATLGDVDSQPLDFTAGLPTADTSGDEIDGPTSVQISGTVDPAGQPTTYGVEYDLQTSLWCESGGTQGTPTAPSSSTSLTGTAAGSYDVTAQLTGLTPGIAYCAALAAQNGSDAGAWSLDVAPTNASVAPVAFVAGVAPSPGVASAADESASATVVSASVDPEDQGTTNVIGYDTAGSEFCRDPATETPSNTVTAAAIASPFETQVVSADLAGLLPGQSYCAAVIATNGSGSATGLATTFIAGQPSVASSAPPSTASPTSETLTGTIDPTGQTAEYYVAYDSASSAWCNPLDGGSPATGATDSTTPVSLGASDSVSVTFGSLAPGGQYCAELFAVTQTANGWTNTSPAGPAQRFTAGYPFTVSTTGTGAIGGSTAVLDGTVNPAGLPTSYVVAYDFAGSDWCSWGGLGGTPTYTTAPVSLAAQDTQDHPVSVTIAGLSPNTQYCAEIVASNAMGAVDGSQLVFATTAGAASVGTGSGSGSGAPSSGAVTAAPSNLALRPAASAARGALASATIDPGGQRTTYHARYAPDSSAFCTSDARSGRSSATVSATLPFTDLSPHTVTVSLPSLTPATRYCVQIVAENASGTTTSPLTVVTTVGAPRLSRLHVAHGRFTRRSSEAISFSVSQAGKVTFTVVKLPDVPGRRAVTIGHFTETVHAGSVRFTFRGRVGRHTLAPGGYLLQAVATDDFRLSGSRASIGFIIVR